uniref:Uncharacterized protein n=1 Tax=Sphaerodactylus townsendi TaxID=933632 RepID=A0ACB8FYJ9_9SAUR
MAVVPKDKKASKEKKKKMKRQQSAPQKNVAKQRKLPSGLRKNICPIRFPKSCFLQNCPLHSRSFNKQMQDSALSFRMAKHTPEFWAKAYNLMTMQAGGQKKQKRPPVLPSFLKATIKTMDKRLAKRKSAPVGKTAKPRRRYSDEEIFYRLAKPSMLARAGPSAAVGKTLNVTRSAHGTPQPPAGELQPMLS